MDLLFEPTPDGLLARMGSDPSIRVGEWTSHPGGAAGAGALIRLRDDGGAVEQDDGTSLLVSWPSVAGLTPDELRYIGLPDAAPFALEVVASGSILDAGFEIHYGFLGKGRRILGVQREGAWLKSHAEHYVLLDPLYTIADRIDGFNQADDADLESRMLRWGQIAEMLPVEAVVNDEHLRSLKIDVASSFELRPFVNSDGEPDFDPVVGRRETRVTEAGEVEQVSAAALPDARQAALARRFRGLSRVKHRYAVGGGTYVVLTSEVETALGAVRRAQAGTAAERQDFLRNVSGYLRGALESTGDDAEVDLDRVFSDEGLSERVRGIGIWEYKALPWIKQAKTPWLPPEALGLRIGSRIVPISANELPAVRDRIKTAIDRGAPTVQVGPGITIPADATTLEAVEELIRKSQPVQPPKLRTKPGKKASADRDNQVLLVIDNLEEVGFSRERRGRTPGIATAAPVLSTRLMPHQEEALAWLRRHWDAGSWGALLADDMGLGKTLAALAFLSSLQTHARDRGLEP